MGAPGRRGRQPRPGPHTAGWGQIRGRCPGPHGHAIGFLPNLMIHAALSVAAGVREDRGRSAAATPPQQQPHAAAGAVGSAVPTVAVAAAATAVAVVAAAAEGQAQGPTVRRRVRSTASRRCSGGCGGRQLHWYTGGGVGRVWMPARGVRDHGPPWCGPVASLPYLSGKEQLAGWSGCGLACVGQPQAPGITYSVGAGSSSTKDRSRGRSSSSCLRDGGRGRSSSCSGGAGCVAMTGAAGGERQGTETAAAAAVR